MKHKLLIAAALATLMAVPSVASAQLSNADDSGWSVSYTHLTLPTICSV